MIVIKNNAAAHNKIWENTLQACYYWFIPVDINVRKCN